MRALDSFLVDAVGFLKYQWRMVTVYIQIRIIGHVCGSQLWKVIFSVNVLALYYTPTANRNNWLILENQVCNYDKCSRYLVSTVHFNSWRPIL